MPSNRTTTSASLASVIINKTISEIAMRRARENQRQRRSISRGRGRPRSSRSRSRR